MSRPNHSPFVPQDWDNFADKNATGADAFDKTARRLIVGGAGSVHLIKPGATTETLFITNCPAGMVITQQFVGIGNSTTATDLCVQY